MPSRREFLKMGLIAGASAALPIERALALTGTATRAPFQVPLRIPSVLTPRRHAGRDHYVMTMRRARVEILPGKRTPAWTFNGEFPGPTIKARRGREVVVKRVNKLHVPTTTHLHGGKVAPASDGQPLDLIEPGGSKKYFYPNDQDAATLWYHDHTHHRASRNNYMGLSGLYIIEDPEEDELNLPKGRYDIPLVIQDRAFKRDGSFRFHDDHDDVLGKRFLVNGRPTPYLRVANRKYRFRLLNASNSRGYTLSLSNGAPLVQIATDGGLLAAPYPASSIELWPSERAEVVIDFSAYPVGTQIVLGDISEDMADPKPLMRFDVAREEADPSSLPMLLKPTERLMGGGTEREFDLRFNLDNQRWEINGKVFDPNRIDVKPRLGETEVWIFRNSSSATHPMHVHLGRMQVLERSNLALLPSDLGWKDTVRVDPSATVKVAVRFEGFTGRYMFHCHNLAHEDHSMMGQLKVIA